NNAQILFKMQAAGGKTFVAYYTGKWNGVLPAYNGTNWTTISDTSSADLLLSANFGKSWTNTPSLGTSWYTDGTSNYGTAPAAPVDGLTQGPVNSAATSITSFA